MSSNEEGRPATDGLPTGTDHQFSPPDADGHNGKPDAFLAWSAQFREKPDPVRPPSPPTPVNGIASPGGNPRYVETAIRSDLERLAAATEGVRNDTLLRVACNVFEFVKGGHADESAARAELTRISAANGLPGWEIENTLRSAWNRVGPRTVPAPDGVPVAAAFTIDPEQAADFWSRPLLAHVRAFARSRRVNPYATLGAVARRAVACTEPNVVLPAHVGDVASANIYMIPAGRSGTGKDAANAAGAAAVAFYASETDVQLNLAIEIPTGNGGSGEGLARWFRGHGKNREGAKTRVDVQLPEVRTLAALADRKGGTLTGELLKGYMGQALGFDNSNQDTTTSVAAHTYRLTLSVGVQPENADFFLAREHDGFPQRFLWLPTTDPEAPAIRPAPVKQINLVLPDFGEDRFVVETPDSVKAAIDEHRWRVLTGAHGVDPLDGHLMLTRLKVAFALMLLDATPDAEGTWVGGRREITEDDWRLAGHLLDVSTATRSAMRSAVDEARRRDNRARGRADAEREVIKVERLEESAIARTRKAILSKLEADKRATRSKLRQACTSILRDYFDPVFDALIGDGFVRPVKVDGRRATRYELTPSAVTT